MFDESRKKTLINRKKSTKGRMQAFLMKPNKYLLIFGNQTGFYCCFQQIIDKFQQFSIISPDYNLRIEKELTNDRP